MTDSHIVNYQTVNKIPKIMHALVPNLTLDDLPVRKTFYEY